jgi:glutathione S-transferase
MAPTLYMFHGSPPVRAVLMTAKAIDLELDIKEIDFLNREQLKPHFLKVFHPKRPHKIHYKFRR